MPKKCRSLICMGCTGLKSLKGCGEIEEECNFSKCINLESIEDFKSKTINNIRLDDCKNLKSLKGCPDEVSANFDCSGCDKLTSLEYAPKKVGGNFDCRYCGVQFTEEDVKKVSKVKGEIIF